VLELLLKLCANVFQLFLFLPKCDGSEKTFRTTAIAYADQSTYVFIHGVCITTTWTSYSKHRPLLSKRTL